SSYAVILGLDPRIEGNGALILANVAQAGSSILGSSPRMTDNSERQRLSPTYRPSPCCAARSFSPTIGRGPQWPITSDAASDPSAPASARLRPRDRPSSTPAAY